jgi:hypothetical protein
MMLTWAAAFIYTISATITMLCARVHDCRVIDRVPVLSVQSIAEMELKSERAGFLPFQTYPI